MAVWNPWRGCHKCSDGCKYCYIHKGDFKRNVNTEDIHKTDSFYNPIKKYERGKNKGLYKMKSGDLVYLCFSSDFLIEEADSWRDECFKMMKMRSDLKFLFLTKRIDRFLKCIPEDWGDGYENVIVGCSVENQENCDYKLTILNELPIKHKIIVCQPLIERVDISKYLNSIEEVIVGGESDFNGRLLDYSWVLDIRRQCIEKNVKFSFRQCSTNFLKDGKLYKLKKNQLIYLAKKANIDI